jgi:hypothetical protein
MHGVKAGRILLAIALSASGASSGNAAPAVDFETHVLMRIQALSIEGDRSTTAGTPREVELGPSLPAVVDLLIPWEKESGPLNVQVTARLSAVTADGQAVLFFESRTTGGTGLGGKPAIASREIRLSEEGRGCSRSSETANVGSS